PLWSCQEISFLRPDLSYNRIQSLIAFVELSETFDQSLLLLTAYLTPTFPLL
ncbi:Hypothetical protein FKW44_017587, partial [Caligus rogercresseyi]